MFVCVHMHAHLMCTHACMHVCMKRNCTFSTQHQSISECLWYNIVVHLNMFIDSETYVFKLTFHHFCSSLPHSHPTMHLLIACGPRRELMEGVTVTDEDGTELVKSKVTEPITHSPHALQRSLDQMVVFASAT